MHLLGRIPSRLNCVAFRYVTYHIFTIVEFMTNLEVGIYFKDESEVKGLNSTSCIWFLIKGESK